MLRIAHYQNWDELQEVREYWNPLLSRSASDTVFLTWQWCAAWWKSYGGHRRLWVLAAWEGKILVGIAPFYLDTARACGKSWNCLRLIGDGSYDSDYLDCFIERGREAEIINAFIHTLERQLVFWDWLEWNGPVHNSPCANLLLRNARERNWSWQVEPIRCAKLNLPQRWNHYLAGLEPRFRTKVRSSLSLIENYLKSVPLECSSIEELQRWLPLFFELHTRRWGTRSKPGVFGGQAKRDFYLDLSRAALEEGWLGFHRLNWGERPLAFQYGLIYRKRFHLLQEAYDPDFAMIRPGLALRAWLLRHWIGAGLQEYDFLAGIATHKLDWGAQEQVATRVLVSPAPVSSLVAVNLPHYRRRAREQIGRLMPAPLRAWRRRADPKPAKDGGSIHAQREHSRVRQVSRWGMAALYSFTPVGRVGRSIANAYAWNRTGQGRWLGLERRTKTVVQILQYHRVTDQGDPFLAGISVGGFRDQMRYLKAHFPFVSLDEMATGEFPGGHPYYMAVTLDDGYRDNFLYAFPILRELHIPATVFLVSGQIESGQLPWYDQLRLAFKLTTRPQFSMAPLGGPCGRLDDCQDRVHGSQRTLHWLRGMNQAERIRNLEELFRELGVPAELNLPGQMLRWVDIRQMLDHGIAFGAHTVTHPVLSKLSLPELEAEIKGSKRMIENRLQRPVLHFAYPFGQGCDLSAEAKQVVVDAGFQTAVTTLWGVNGPSSDRFELRRLTPWEANAAEFGMKLDWYRWLEMPSVAEHRGM